MSSEMETPYWEHAWIDSPRWAHGIVYPIQFQDEPQRIFPCGVVLSAADWKAFIFYMRKHGVALTVVEMINNGWNKKDAQEFVTSCIALCIKHGGEAQRRPQAPEEGRAGS